MIYRYDYGNRNTTTTIEGWVIANNWCDLGIQTPDQMVELGRKEIFDFQYPFYSESESDRESFERTFILRFFSRQVALETEAAFKLRLLARLTEYMPEFEQLFRSITMDYDPLVNRRWTRVSDASRSSSGQKTGNRNTDQNTQSNSSGNSSSHGSSESSSSGTSHRSTDNQDINSKNPQINFSGKDFAAEMTRGKTETDGTTGENTEGSSDASQNYTDTGTVKNTGKENTEENHSESGSENGQEHMEGFEGSSQAEMIMKYRETIININSMLCDRLEVLFSIWQ